MIDSAADMAIRAFEDDPLFHYLEVPNESGDPVPLSRTAVFIKKLIYRFVMFRGWKTCITYEVAGASSVCISELAPNDPARKYDCLDVIMNWLAAWLERKATTIGSEERQNRYKEFGMQLEALKEELIEPRKQDLMYLNLITTDPACHGRGYGSRLLEYMNDIADSRGRATWLFSSKYSNTPFYNSHGYEEVARVVVGENNPLWKLPPVVVPIMIREPVPVGSLHVDEDQG